MYFVVFVFLVNNNCCLLLFDIIVVVIVSKNICVDVLAQYDFAAAYFLIADFDMERVSDEEGIKMFFSPNDATIISRYKMLVSI